MTAIGVQPKQKLTFSFFLAAVFLDVASVFFLTFGGIIKTAVRRRELVVVETLV
jgi:hypothetical protein